MRVEEFFS